MNHNAHEAITAARALLPAWVSWVNVAVPVLVTFVLTVTSLEAGAAVAFALRERRVGDDWAERARAAFPVRQSMALGMLVVSVALGMLPSWSSGPLSPVSELVSVVCGHVPAAMCGAMLVSSHVRRRLGDPPRGRPFGNFAFGLLLMFPHWLVITVVVGVVARTPDGTGVTAFAAGVVAIAFLYLGGGLLMLRILGVAIPASARLAHVVQSTSERVGVRPGRIYEIRTSVANAFAIPTSRQLAVTEAALAVLDDDEIAAVCAHELGHLAEPWPVLAARCAEPLVFMSALAVAARADRWDSAGVWAAGAAALGVYVAMRALRRRREERADEVAHRHQAAPGIHGRALAKLHEANRIPMVLRGRRHTHPDLVDRMAASGASLPIDRPAPPARLPAIAGVGATTLVVCAFAVGWGSLLENRLHSGRYDRRACLWHIALRGGHASELAQLGYLSWRNEAYDDAITFDRAAFVLDPDYALDLVQVLANARRCDEAERVLARAQGRFRRRDLRVSEREVDQCRGEAKREFSD